jgi:starch synthase
MSRIVHQKMPDVVLEALPPLIERGMQFALVGEGDRAYEDGFRALQDRYPGRVAVKIGYREDIAHRLLAGADILLHPARFEPCGLVPLYAMRYGTIPVTCHNGGTADSVIDVSDAGVKQGTATGFSFEEPTTAGLIACLDRAWDLFQKPLAWRKLQTNAMRQDFSWNNSAKAYDELYRTLVPAITEEPQAKRSA